MEDVHKKQSPFVHQELLALGSNQTEIIVYSVVILFFGGKAFNKYLKTFKGHILSFLVSVELTMNDMLGSGALCLNFSCP